jgi:hypothetical protein
MYAYVCVCVCIYIYIKASNIHQSLLHLNFYYNSLMMALGRHTMWEVNL